MDMFGRLRGLFSKRDNLETDPLSDGPPPWSANPVRLSGGGYPVSWFAPRQFHAGAAMKLPAVHAAVNGIANAVAGLPRAVVATGTDEPVDDDESAVVTERWTPIEHTAADGLRFWLRSILLYGRGAAFVLRRGEDVYTRAPLGAPVERIVPLDPVGLSRSLVSGRLEYRVVLASGEQVLVDRDRLLWLSFAPPFNGYLDRSPLADPWPAIRAGIEATEFSANFFMRGANADTYLTNDESDADEYRKNVALINRQYDEMRAGHRRTIVLPAGWKMETAPSNLGEADMVAPRVLAVQEVARVYDVTPLELKDLSRSSYSNYAQSAENDAKTMIGWAKRVAAEMDSILWPLGGRRIRFDWNDLVERLLLERLKAYAVGIDRGILSRNEVRARLGLPEVDVDGMDDYVRDEPAPIQVNARATPVNRLNGVVP